MFFLCSSKYNKIPSVMHLKANIINILKLMSESGAELTGKAYTEFLYVHMWEILCVFQQVHHLLHWKTFSPLGDSMVRHEREKMQAAHPGREQQQHSVSDANLMPSVLSAKEGYGGLSSNTSNTKLLVRFVGFGQELQLHKHRENGFWHFFNTNFHA